MIESISGIISLFNGLKEGLTGSWEIIKKGKKKRVIRKLVKLKLTLEDIIETASEIFTSIEGMNKTKRTPKKDLDALKELISVQFSNLRDLQSSFYDPTSSKILKTFESELRRNIDNLTQSKRSRIDYFMDDFYDLEASRIRAKYNENYLKEGKKLIEELAKTSESYSKFLKENIEIEDVI